MTDQPRPIDLQETATGGRYVIALEGGDEAEMTFRAEPGIMAIDHTFVPPAYRGQSLAEDLVRRGIADARGKGLKIRPICPYVAVQFRRHPEWRDLLAE